MCAIECGDLCESIKNNEATSRVMVCFDWMNTALSLDENVEIDARGIWGTEIW